MQGQGLSNPYKPPLTSLKAQIVFTKIGSLDWPNRSVSLHYTVQDEHPLSRHGAVGIPSAMRMERIGPKYGSFSLLQNPAAVPREWLSFSSEMIIQ
jgi:hypothetical protein